MPISPARSASEHLSAILHRLMLVLDSRRSAGLLGNPVMIRIIMRLLGIRDRVARIAALLEAGCYRPRRAAKRAPRRKPENGGGARERLPHRIGWLPRLVPEAQVARAHLTWLFQQPEMVALMQAAPAALRRPLRSLCHMLGATPPAALAIPSKPAPPPPQAPPPAPTPAPTPAPPDLRPYKRPPGPRRRRLPAAASGPPLPHPA